MSSRAEALERLQAFLPHAGADYATQRNFDLGPDQRSNVSNLSPWLRHRLITEQEVCTAVLAQHSVTAAEKFLQEVCWRSYWKGWLEQHPDIWLRYQDDLAALIPPSSHAPWAKGYAAAISGQTQISCFDAWVQELQSTGTLHNHARMWLASIWIFTLRLPWQLGADFFHRHLLDGDPASNTLSWRWVAGLHTRGKHYLARASNIEQFTQGRFAPYGVLDESASALPADALPTLVPLRTVQALERHKPTGLLLTEEDLHAPSWPLAGLLPLAVAGFTVTETRSHLPISPQVMAFTSAAMDDGLATAAAHFACLSTRLNVAEVLAWAQRHSLQQLVTAYAPTGPAADALMALKPPLEAAGIRLVTLRRSWDSAFWPHAAKGYFQVKAKIPDLLKQLCA
jgi:deoxyribodipyrimidine photo-lyase